MVICSNGHNLCFSCSEQVNQCPTCREPRLPKPIRNLALEKVIEENMLALASVPEIYSTEITDLGRRLGRGSSAEVKAGLWHGGEVAIKVFQIHENDSYLKALKIESSFASRLQHPNIVRIYGITRMQSDTPAIVMERADKGSLREFIGKLSYPQKVSIARGTLEGIAYLHSRKVAHRDLKPENILLFGDKLVPKISDFGTSRIVQASMVNTMMTGTPKYCAPELLDEGLHYGTPVDVYSLSLILLELFTGEDPFKGCRSVAQVVAAIMRDQRPQIPSDFPEALKPLLEKGWSKVPLLRPPLTLFRDALQKVSDDLENELAKKTAAQLKSLTLETPSPESSPGIPEANDPRPTHRMSKMNAFFFSKALQERQRHPLMKDSKELFVNSVELNLKTQGSFGFTRLDANSDGKRSSIDSRGRKREVKLPTPVPRLFPRLSSPESESPDRPDSPARLVSHPSPPPISRQESTPTNPIASRKSSPTPTVEPSTSFAGAAAASSSEKLQGIPCEFCGAQFNDSNAFLIHEMGCLDPGMREFLVKAGVSESELKDENTMKFIYDFLQDHGGVEAVIGETSDQPRTPPVSHPGPSAPPPAHPYPLRSRRMRPPVVHGASFSRKSPLSQPSRAPSAAPPSPPPAPSAMGAGAPPGRSDLFEGIARREAMKEQEEITQRLQEQLSVLQQQLNRQLEEGKRAVKPSPSHRSWKPWRLFRSRRDGTHPRSAVTSNLEIPAPASPLATLR
ncbi:unnamed protein product, partial [Cyprideis torosa]